jgi:hypothetical protein
MCISNAIYIKKLKDYSRLKLYRTIKTQVSREKYLSNIKNESYRKSVTCLRISSHKFPIETGRYNNTEQEQRICTKCTISIGTEYHCIMECYHPELTMLRNNYLKIIYQINPSLRKFNRVTLFKYIILCSDTTILNVTSKFIHEIVNMYNS